MSGFVLISAAWPGKVNSITIAADSWCPINCSRSDRHEGVGIDLARAVYESQGFKVRYVIMPWTDALDKVRAGKIDAVIGASIYDERSLVFPREPVYNISDDFYVLKGNSWRFYGIPSLKGKKIGVIEDYGYGIAIHDYIRDHRSHANLVQTATGDKALQANLKKLLSYQVDVVVETRPVMEYNLAKSRLSDRVQWAGSSPQAPVYLAFSPAISRSQALADMFDAGIKQLTEDGRLEGFYRKYSLSARDRR